VETSSRWLCVLPGGGAVPLASPQRGEVGGGNRVDGILPRALSPAGPPPTSPPPAGGSPHPRPQGESQVTRGGEAWRIFPGNRLGCRACCAIAYSTRCAARRTPQQPRCQQRKGVSSIQMWTKNTPLLRFAWRMKPHSHPQKTNMHHARTIHRQCLDGCPSYDRFAKGASTIVTPAEMLVPTLPSRVKQSYAPACLRIPRRDLRTLRVVTHWTRVAQVV
jgi:hypothetical protein